MNKMNELCEMELTGRYEEKLSALKAEISAADAVLYMITTSFTKDLYKSFINPNVSDESLIKGSRFVTVMAGIIGIGLAIVLPNVISALSIFYKKILFYLSK